MKVVIYPPARFQEHSSVYFYDWEVELGSGGFGLSLYKKFSPELAVCECVLYYSPRFNSLSGSYDLLSLLLS